MKINMKTLGIIGLLVVVVAGGILFQMRSSAVSSKKADEEALTIENLRRVSLNAQKQTLNQQIIDAREAVEQAEIRLTVLEETLVLAESELEDAKAKYPALVETIEYTETLLEMARSAGVTLLNISSSDGGTAGFSTKEFVFRGTNFTMNVTGDVLNILKFVDIVTASQDFRSGRIGNVDLSVPLPVPPLVVTQQEQDAISDRIWQEMVLEMRAALSPYAMVVFTGQAVLEVLGAGSNNVTMETITERIRMAISAKFGALIANQFAPELAIAVEQALADSLVDIISTIYANEIGALFEAGDPQLTPEYGGILGEEITAELQNIPPSMVGGVVQELITRNINQVLDGYIEDLVSTEDHAARVAEEVAAILAGAPVTPLSAAGLSLTLFTFGDN